MSLFQAFSAIALHFIDSVNSIFGFADVAVVGLPRPRKNHATEMARFARDCRAKMNEILPELEEKLGEVCERNALQNLIFYNRSHFCPVS